MTNFQWVVAIGLIAIPMMLLLVIELLGRVVTEVARAARPTEQGMDSVVAAIDRIDATLDRLEGRLFELQDLQRPRSNHDD